VYKIDKGRSVRVRSTGQCGGIFENWHLPVGLLLTIHDWAISSGIISAYCKHCRTRFGSSYWRSVITFTVWDL